MGQSRLPHITGRKFNPARRQSSTPETRILKDMKLELCTSIMTTRCLADQVLEDPEGKTWSTRTASIRGRLRGFQVLQTI